MSKHDHAYFSDILIAMVELEMNEEDRARLKSAIKLAIGKLLCSLRMDAGLSQERVAEILGTATLEKIKRVEAGEDTLQNLELVRLIQVYGADLVEVRASIQAIGARERAQL